MKIFFGNNFNQYRYNSTKNTMHKTSQTVSFEGQRVDKGLDRFSSFNENRMPDTLLRYLKNTDKKNETPLQAQKNAFELLSIVDTVDDIKSAYPDEKLFSELREIKETYKTTNLLKLAKKLAPTMKELNISLLDNGEDFTVYLVKKIFLEAKNIKEINNDLDKDLNELFRSDYKMQYKNSPYLSSDTLKALGIKLPNRYYMNSLRFTRDGYSDLFGEITSLALKLYYDSLTQEQRYALAKKSTEKLENWWGTLSGDKKLEMIADSENTLNMLKDFNEYKKQSQDAIENQKVSSEKKFSNKSETQVRHLRVGSEVLAKDEFFKRWAANKLAIYQESLSDKEKAQLNIKRARNAAQRWAQMTPEDKTAYITNLKTGSEPMRYAMIDAWNNSFGLLLDLSLFLTKKHIEKPEETIFSKDTMSEFMSSIMTDFWSMHTEEAKQFGIEISKAWQKVEVAIANNRFEQMKTEIMQKRKMRTFELQKTKFELSQNLSAQTHVSKQSLEKEESVEKTNVEKNINKKSVLLNQKETNKVVLGERPLKQIKDEFGLSLFGEYVKSYIDEIVKYTDIPQDMTMDEINEKGIVVTERVLPENKPIVDKINESRVFALMYLLNLYFDKSSYGIDSDYVNYINQILPQLKNSSKKITYHNGTSLKTINIKKGAFDGNRLIPLYKELVKPLSEQDARQIMRKYFPKEIDGKPVEMSDETREKVFEYIKNYGTNLLNKIFTEDSPNRYDMQMFYYNNFKSRVFRENPNEIKGLLDTEEFKFIFKNKFQLQKILKRKFPYWPDEFISAYLNMSFSCLTQEAKRFSQFKKYTLGTGTPDMPLYAYPYLKSNITLDEKIKLLAMEKAMSDVLYSVSIDNSGFVFNTDKDSTGDNRGYLLTLKIEDLCNLVKVVFDSKTFPAAIAVHSGKTGTTVPVVFKEKPNLAKIERKYNRYMENCKDWMANIQKNPSLTKEEKMDELMFILNPKEDREDVDIAIKDRFEIYKLKDDIMSEKNS